MTDVYQTTRNKEKTVAELLTSTKALRDNNIDMFICEVCYIIKVTTVRAQLLTAL